MKFDDRYTYNILGSEIKTLSQAVLEQSWTPNLLRFKWNGVQATETAGAKALWWK